MLKNIKKKLKDSSASKGEEKGKSNYEGQLAVDVYETKDAIVIKAPIAGVKLVDVNITITDDVLTIRGERKAEEDLARKNYLTQECYWGAFSRSIILPENINKDDIKAKFKEGVLHVTLAKGAAPKEVQVED